MSLLGAKHYLVYYSLLLTIVCTDFIIIEYQSLLLCKGLLYSTVVVVLEITCYLLAYLEFNFTCDTVMEVASSA